MANGGLLELYRKKLLLELLSDDDIKALIESKDSRLLQKIDRQTSTSSGIYQNIIGNVITDGSIFLLKKLFKL
jgi:hypothetical protein